MSVFNYHTHGLVDYQFQSSEYKDGANWYHVHLEEHGCRCAGCGGRRVVKNGTFERVFRDVPAGLRPSFIVLHGHRQLCRGCGANPHEPVRSADPTARHTRRTGRYTTSPAGFMAILHASLFPRADWDLVKAALSRHLRHELKKRELGGVRYIATDEFAARKGHKYATVVLDLETGAVLHAAKGEGANAVTPFLWKLRRANAPVAAAAMDMSATARASCEKTAGGAEERRGFPGPLLPKTPAYLRL